MNIEKLRALINFYIENEEKIHFNKLEGYKWRILFSIRNEIITYINRHYKHGEWDQDYTDFQEFIKKTVGKTGNLVFFRARTVIQNASLKYPERVRKMFIDLSGINSDVTLKDRVCHFIRSLDEMAAEDPNIYVSGESYHNDYRAISVYLLMMNPAENYNYMYSTFSKFAKYVEMKIPKAGDVHLLIEYYDACNEIERILRKEYRNWFDNYLQLQRSGDSNGENRTDTSGHLLIQDIIFGLYYYNHPNELPDTNNVVVPKKFKKKPIPQKTVPGPGKIVDYVAKQQRNMAIGAAVENFVFENERRLVAKYGLDPNRVRHSSKDEGDGLGYDIISCDRDGKEIYIEVKGTDGGEGTPFYITETELQCSIMHADKYRLYRVYNFVTAGTSGRGKIAVIEGSLQGYCINPISYRVMF